ncbi:MAG: UDP-N-acetylmuramoyl-tripeptide--D-alanyl-D-alanine ligase [Defluviitaleaceae bacterium]|nr:UDP-N-acetylmuramoyl-tripeptide--D-alanyl-D-alanine ligase [Defluviitaleaceae bacterium]
MKSINLEMAALAMGGVLNWTNLSNVPIAGASFDSREDQTGKIFFAIRGKRDGHRYMAEAINKGAICAVSQIQTDLPAIIVPDTLWAMGDFAQFYLSQLKATVIGITGSNGKTTVKDMVAAVLSRKYRVAKTLGNYNNHLGLPMTIFNMDENTEIAVLELGMNHRGEIYRLSEICKPKYVVITNIGTAHIENLGSQEEIFAAKSEILDFWDERGKVFLKGDDVFLREYKGRKNYRFFGVKNDNDYMATEIKSYGLDSEFTLKTKEGIEQEIKLSIPGEHMAINALAACALGLEFGIAPHEIAETLADFMPSDRRMNIIDVDGVTIIDDSYNASPDSMRAAIDVLAKISGRKIAILGDMFELGDLSHDFHYDIGVYAVKKGINLIIAIGENARYIYAGAVDAANEAVNAAEISNR